MKACSSAQRKEAFKTIQNHRKEWPLQLLLDMKVRWSSTFIMLTCAESRWQVYQILFIVLFPLVLILMNVQVVDEFVYELRLKESNVEKRRKINSCFVLRLDFILPRRYIGLPRLLLFFPSPWSPCTIRSGKFTLYDTIWQLFWVLFVQYQSPSHAYYNT